MDFSPEKRWILSLCQRDADGDCGTYKKVEIEWEETVGLV